MLCKWVLYVFPRIWLEWIKYGKVNERYRVIREDFCVDFNQYNKPGVQVLATPSTRLPGITRNDRRATVFGGGVAHQTCVFENSGNSFSHSPNHSSRHARGALDFEWCSINDFCIETTSTPISVHDPISIVLNWVYTLIIFSICWTPLSANKTSLSPSVINGESTRRWCHRGAFQKHLWALKSKSS